MTPEEEIQRAEEARFVLENALFKAAIDEVEAALLNGIKQSAFKDSELREKLCQQYILLHSLVGRLKTHMETGKLAEATIKQRTAFERMKSVVGL